MAASVSSALSFEELELREVPAADFRTLPVLSTSDPAVLDNARAITALGHQLGRRTDVFMKVGDSNTDFVYADNGYLFPLGDPGYNPVLSGLAAVRPGELDTLAVYRTPISPLGDNSFSRHSTAAYPGWNTAAMLAAAPGELAATDAGVALIMTGTNDTNRLSNDQYRAELVQLVTMFTSAGVLPVLTTVPDSTFAGGELEASGLAFNQVIADVAGQYHLPLLNLWRELQSLPNHGLDAGGVHLDQAPDGGGDFTPLGLAYGQNVRNLGVLDILDWYRKDVLAPAAVPPVTAWTPLPADRAVFAVGLDAGQAPAVEVRDAATGQVINRFLAFDPSFSGGVRVAMADVNGDGFTDVVAVPGIGGGPVVEVFSGKDGSRLAGFYAFDPGFRNGFSVAAGDLDGDGKAEIVVGAGNGGGPQVGVFHGGDFRSVSQFYAFDGAFRGGVNVGVGNFAGIGPAVVAGAGVGGGPEVRLFRYGSFTPAASFFAFDGTTRGGVNVAAGDLTGGGTDELVAAPAGGSPEVRVFDPRSGSVLGDILSPDPTVISGARLAVVPTGANSPARLLVANGSGGPTSVQSYLGITAHPDTLFADPGRAYGLYVG